MAHEESKLSSGSRVWAAMVASARDARAGHLMGSSHAVDVRDGLALIAHEVRAHLGGVKGFALTLRDRGEKMTPEDRRAAYDALVRSSDALAELAENLLDLDRVDDGKLDLQDEPTDIASLIAEVVAGVEETFPSTPFEVNVTGGPLLVLGDHAALARTLENLLRNAVRHARAGTPVGVEATRVLDSVIVSVRNDGDPLPAGVQEHLFERFGPVTSGGTGLGLYLSRVVIEAHDGRIWFAGDDGNRFEFLLPLLAG